MDLGIKGKTAIMAGGSAGMGRATAERLAEAGVDLYISARREERLNNAAKEISEKIRNIGDARRCRLFNGRWSQGFVCGLSRPGHSRDYDQATSPQWRLLENHAGYVARVD